MRSLNELSLRISVPIYTKMKQKEAGCHLTKCKRQKEYSYYKCDYCGDEIIIKNKRYEMTGGTIVFGNLITKQGKIEMALCNKCLKPMLKKFEETE